jgi:hypothetical protein
MLIEIERRLEIAKGRCCEGTVPLAGLAGRLAGIGWSVGWWDWLVGWLGLADRLAGVGWSVGWGLVDWLGIGRLAGVG